VTSIRLRCAGLSAGRSRPFGTGALLRCAPRSGANVPNVRTGHGRAGKAGLVGERATGAALNGASGEGVRGVLIRQGRTGEILHCKPFCSSFVRSLLSASEAPPIFARMQISLPFVMKTKWGAVKFGYGGRTIYFAQGLDEAEGRMIVGRLLRGLPAKAGG
jgi:hypothetical protein